MIYNHLLCSIPQKMRVLYILWNKLLKPFYNNIVHLFTLPVTSCTTNKYIGGLFSFFRKCINFQINNFSVTSVRCHRCLGIGMASTMGTYNVFVIGTVQRHDVSNHQLLGCLHSLTFFFIKLFPHSIYHVRHQNMNLSIL